jgi:hypothetical protein
VHGGIARHVEQAFRVLEGRQFRKVVHSHAQPMQ